MTGTGTKPSILPNEKSLVSQNISSSFNTIKSMQGNTYGLSSYDSHMMKNMEWGAVAYLSHSKYGKNGEIWINNVWTGASSITGCSGASASVSQVTAATCPSGCKYNETGGINASTTGNITGIYDTSGGVWERTMGVMLDIQGKPIYAASGFTLSTLPIEKYYDTYQTTTGNADFPKGKFGDATREILKAVSGGSAGWYGDHSYMLITASPWFTRSGHVSSTSGAGIYHFNNSNGGASANGGSRAVLTHQ